MTQRRHLVYRDEKDKITNWKILWGWERSRKVNLKLNLYVDIDIDVDVRIDEKGRGTDGDVRWNKNKKGEERKEEREWKDEKRK